MLLGLLFLLFCYLSMIYNMIYTVLLTTWFMTMTYGLRVSAVSGVL